MRRCIIPGSDRHDERMPVALGALDFERLFYPAAAAGSPILNPARSSIVLNSALAADFE